MASRRPSTRANPKGLPATPVSDPKEILRGARVSLRQTSRAVRGATLGISKGISAVISNRPPFQSSYAEASSSQKFISKSENFRVEESSSTTACVYPILGDSTEINTLLTTPKVPLSSLSMPTSNMNVPLTKIERILVSRYA